MRKNSIGKCLRDNKVVICLMITALIFASICEFLFGLFHANSRNVRVIKSDGAGYYAYLPAIFDYQDMSFSFTENSFSGIWTDSDGNVINKYSVGTAVLASPFFLCADAIYKFFNPLMSTGYSKGYNIAMVLSGLFYFLLGLFFLYRILIRWFSEKATNMTLLSIIFGTSLLHYATYDITFSHVYSFAMITLFIWLTTRIEEDVKDSIGRHLGLGIVAGLIFDIRNLNIIILFFYIFYKVGRGQSLVERAKKIFSLRRIIPNFFGLILGISPQIVYWLVATGKPIIRSYSGSETFSWLFPHILNGLFSVEKGLFFWSPILLIAVIGVIKTRKSDLPFWGLFVCIILHMYISLSWDCWWYGSCFGQRAYIDVYAAYAIGLAYIYDKLNASYITLFNSNDLVKSKQNVMSLFSPIIVFFLAISVKLTMAYWENIIPTDKASMTDVMEAFEWQMESYRSDINEVFLEKRENYPGSKKTGMNNISGFWNDGDHLWSSDVLGEIVLHNPKIYEKGLQIEVIVNENTLLDGKSEVSILVNDVFVKKVIFEKAGNYTIRVESELFDRLVEDEVKIGIDYPTTFSPSKMGLSDDNRELGLVVMYVGEIR